MTDYEETAADTATAVIEPPRAVNDVQSTESTLVFSEGSAMEKEP